MGTWKSALSASEELHVIASPQEPVGGPPSLRAHLRTGQEVSSVPLDDLMKTLARLEEKNRKVGRHVSAFYRRVEIDEKLKFRSILFQALESRLH